MAEDNVVREDEGVEGLVAPEMAPDGAETPHMENPEVSEEEDAEDENEDHA